MQGSGSGWLRVFGVCGSAFSATVGVYDLGLGVYGLGVLTLAEKPDACLESVKATAKYCAAVQELELSHYDEETLLSTKDPYIMVS